MSKKLQKSHTFSFSFFVGAQAGVKYVHTPMGLFPAPLARNAKSQVVNRIKSKFKFIGKFMAKALMDSRMVSSVIS